MAASFTLRPATPADVEAILVVHVASIIANGSATYTDRQVAAWAAKPEGTERYLDAIARESTEVVVAAADEHVLGFGELDVESGEIESIFVDPEHTGEGIGSAILERFEGRLRTEGFAVARLRAVLNAVGFYEARGYSGTERVTTTTTNDVELDSVWMEKAL